MASPKTILLTGAAGFIGFHCARLYLEGGARVVGIDNLNAYYDPALKAARLKMLEKAPGFTFHKLDLEDSAAIAGVFAETKPDIVVHLAAQAGVRHSLDAPQTYVDSNVTGFLSILEACRHHGCGHLVYASTSSVYGLDTAMPFQETRGASHPISLYAATKRANELMAHTYSHLFRIPTTGVRFFTVYGPWGRPDMALFKFTKLMLDNKPIPIFNNGEMQRDFTYVSDIVEAIVRLADTLPEPKADWDEDRPDPSASPSAPYRVFNIGNSKPVDLMRYIGALEASLGMTAEKEFLPLQPGDVTRTWADTTLLDAAIGYAPDTSVEDGVAAFVDWYRSYFDA